MLRNSFNSLHFAFQRSSHSSSSSWPSSSPANYRRTGTVSPVDGVSLLIQPLYLPLPLEGGSLILHGAHSFTHSVALFEGSTGLVVKKKVLRGRRRRIGIACPPRFYDGGTFVTAFLFSRNNNTRARWPSTERRVFEQISRDAATRPPTTTPHN